MKPDLIEAHMDVALRYARQSKARRLKVGAIVVKDNKVISIGWNGTPKGWHTNECEDRINPTLEDRKRLSPKEFEAAFPFVDDRSFDADETENRYALVTKPEVIHAERNAISKLARSHESGEGAAIFVTHQPCYECAKEIHSAGISKVYFLYPYRIMDGLDYLNKVGIPAIQLERDDQSRINALREELLMLMQNCPAL
jgi:dCMP deaminase